MQTYQSMRGKAPLILNLGITWSLVVKCTPRPLYLRYQLNTQDSADPRADVRFRSKQKSLALAGNRAQRRLAHSRVIYQPFSQVNKLYKHHESQEG